jgi:hypothetical protein
VNCATSAHSIWIVSAAIDSAMSWAAHVPGRGYNRGRNDGVGFHDRDGESTKLPSRFTEFEGIIELDVGTKTQA